MKCLLAPLAATALLAGCSAYHDMSLREAPLRSRAAETGKERRLTTTQIQSRKRASAQKDHVILGSWEAANFIPIAHQGAFGAVLKARKKGDKSLPRFNKKHIMGREELSMSSLEKTVESRALLDIDITDLAGNSGNDLVLHHDKRIGRTTGRRPGRPGKTFPSWSDGFSRSKAVQAFPSWSDGFSRSKAVQAVQAFPRMEELSLSELPDYGIHLIGGGYAKILTLAEFIEAFPNEAFSVETKSRSAAVYLVDFVNHLPEAERTRFLNRAIIFAIARPRDESALGPEFATAEPTRILRDGLGDTAVIGSSEAETIAFVKAYGIPAVSWILRHLIGGPPLTLEGDVLGAPATGLTTIPVIGKFPIIRSLPTISRGMIKEAHKQGVMVLPWTIDRKRALNRAVRIGADGVYSNDPRILNALIQEMGDTAKPVISRTK